MTDRADRPIQVGDLVIFVRACCSKGDPYLGHVYRVEGMQGQFPGVHCDGCNAMHTGTKFARFKLTANSPYTAWIPPHWLKRIPPLDELEGSKTDEPIQEPV